MTAARSIPLLALLAILSPLSVVNAEKSIEDYVQEAMRRKVVTVPIEDASGTPGIMVVMAVNAPRKRIWDVLVDYTHYRKVFKDFSRIEVLRQNRQGAYVEYWANAIVTNVHYTLYRSYDRPYHSISWHRTSGDLKRIEGSWMILDAPSSPSTKIMIHRSFVDPGSLFPVRLVRFTALRKAKINGYRLRSWIEKGSVDEISEADI